MTRYLVILLDDTSVSFCHYANAKTERRPIPLETLKAAIVYAMKEDLSIQFVYPCYQLSAEYEEAIESVAHVKIKPSCCANAADVIVFEGIKSLCGFTCFSNGMSYALRVGRRELFDYTASIIPLLYKVERLNIIIIDIETFGEEDFKAYAAALRTLADGVEEVYVSGKAVQLNLLTDRMMLDKMNNCGAGDTSITLAPNGKFYACPAFYMSDGNSPAGDLSHGLNIKNPQLYRLNHAPLCRNCDAYQCRRCVWLNGKTTQEVNTPSHEQCVTAHLERNASRKLLQAIRKHGDFLPEMGEIKEIAYLDPFEARNDW